MVLDADDLFLTETEINGDTLPPGETVSVKLKRKDLQSVEGQFAIITIDDEAAIDESSEGNNTLVQKIGRRGCAKDTFRLEQEPNDSPSEAQKSGNIRPGHCVTINGDVSINTENDTDFDAYRLKVQWTQTLDIILTHPSGADFDLGIFDVSADEFVTLCELDTSPETCSQRVVPQSLDAGSSFDIVVLPFSGAGPYTLSITSRQ